MWDKTVQIKTDNSQHEILKKLGGWGYKTSWLFSEWQYIIINTDNTIGWSGDYISNCISYTAEEFLALELDTKPIDYPDIHPTIIHCWKEGLAIKCKDSDGDISYISGVDDSLLTGDPINLHMDAKPILKENK